eukprot:363564-Chlamydomonas_euryale.AAC.17
MFTHGHCVIAPPACTWSVSSGLPGMSLTCVEPAWPMHHCTTSLHKVSHGYSSSACTRSHIATQAQLAHGPTWLLKLSLHKVPHGYSSSACTRSHMATQAQLAHGRTWLLKLSLHTVPHGYSRQHARTCYVTT